MFTTKQMSFLDVMVLFQLFRDEPENREALFTHILEKFPQIKTLVYAINAKQNDSIYDLDITHLAKRSFYVDCTSK